MFEEIVTEEEIKFNNLEKKTFKFVCNFGCLIIKLILESYDRKIMKARDTKKYRHKGLRKNTIKTVMGEVEYVATEKTKEGDGIQKGHIENNFINKILKCRDISELKLSF